MLVNKTSLDIIYNSKSVCPKFSNDFLMGRLVTEKLAIRSEGFKPSEEFSIKTIGMSGVLDLDHVDPLSNRQLQFGFSISQASYPYNKTNLITIVPRYVLINRLNQPVLVK